MELGQRVSGSQLSMPAIEMSCISMQKLCWWNAASMINIVCQNLTPNGLLKMRYLETNNPNASSIKSCSLDREKLYASLGESCLSLPLYGRRVVDNVYALSDLEPIKPASSSVHVAHCSLLKASSDNSSEKPTLIRWNLSFSKILSGVLQSSAGKSAAREGAAVRKIFFQNPQAHDYVLRPWIRHETLRRY